MKDNLMLKTEGQLQDDYMTLMGRRAMYPLCKAKSSKEKESCVICFDEDIDSDLMFSVDTCRHRFCVNCVKQHLTVKLLDGTIPNCLHHGCTTQLSVDTCGQCRAYTFGDLRLIFKNMDFSHKKKNIYIYIYLPKKKNIYIYIIEIVNT